MSDAQIQSIPVEQLQPHPDNPRLRLRDDVVTQIAAEITRSGFGPEHALLVRPVEGGYQIVSGHHRIEAAKRAGHVEVPCWVREMDDDEAFMSLVLANSQGELAPLEIGIHALMAVPRARGGRGQRGGLSQYADRVGRDRSRITQLRSAADVAQTVESTQQFELAELLNRADHLYEISKTDPALWPLLVERMHSLTWTASDTAHHVGVIRGFEIPEHWSWWLPLPDVVRRYLTTREFAPATVAKLVILADQVVTWIDANAREPEHGHAEFRRWLEEQGEHGWQPRAVAGYLQRLIASQFVTEGWHHGDWRDHLDKLTDGSVALLLTDPPYGMGYQSDYRLDRRQDRKHQPIVSDDADAVTEVQSMLEAFAPKLADDAHVLVFCGWLGEPDMREVVTKAGYVLRGSLIWDKQATGMGDPTTTFAPAHERILHAVKGSPPLYERAADVLRCRRCDSSRHPTEKPIELLIQLIAATTVEGQIVADPFGGVGSTAVSAKTSGRRWFGCEIDETYWRAGEERLLS